MGHKKLCLNCRKAFNREFDNNSDHLYKCPDCGREMILMPHRFRPPKRTDDMKWETVKFLIEHGFRYQHVYESINSKLINSSSTIYATYPENIREAKEFVEKYKAQALTSNK